MKRNFAISRQGSNTRPLAFIHVLYHWAMALDQARSRRDEWNYQRCRVTRQKSPNLWCFQGFSSLPGDHHGHSRNCAGLKSFDYYVTIWTLHSCGSDRGNPRQMPSRVTAVALQKQGKKQYIFFFRWNLVAATLVNKFLETLSTRQMRSAHKHTPVTHIQRDAKSCECQTLRVDLHGSRFEFKCDFLL